MIKKQNNDFFYAMLIVTKYLHMAVLQSQGSCNSFFTLSLYLNLKNVLTIFYMAYIITHRELSMGCDFERWTKEE